MKIYYLMVLLPLLLHLVPPCDLRTVHIVTGGHDNTSAKSFQCSEVQAADRKVSGTILLCLGVMGCLANLVVVVVMLATRYLRRWSMSLVFHQCVVDMSRSAILLPLGRSLYTCTPVTTCPVLETAFLLLATVSVVGRTILVVPQPKPQQS